MTFVEWLQNKGEQDRKSVLLAQEAWEAAQSSVRVQFFKKANWVSINGIFSPDRLREIAAEVERGNGVSI